MKTMKLTLTLSLLSLVSYTATMEGSMRPQLQAIIPTATMQSEAAALYHQIENANRTKGNATMELPSDFIELLKNSFTFVHEMNPNEMQKIEQMHMAYCSLEFPPFASSLVQEVMGNNGEFMKAFATYEKTWGDAQMAIGTLMMDIQNTDSKANPSEDLKKLLTLKKASQDQLATLQKMFMADKANAALMMHMKKMEYLAEQHVRWGIAFAMAVNPDMVKDVSPQAFQQAKDAVKTIFTSSTINSFKNHIAAAKQK